MQLWEHGGARARIGIDGLVLVVQVSGVVTSANWKSLVAFVAQGYSTRPVYAMVCFCERALFAFAEIPLLPQVGGDVRKLIPGAIVVSPELTGLARSYCWAMAQQGIERITFSEPSQAWRWARERAAQVLAFRPPPASRVSRLAAPAGK